MTIAQELSNTSLRVTVLESGGSARQTAADSLDEIESAGWPRVADQWLVRNRILGGSSHTWGGRCAPLNEVDLEARDWVPDSGWPFKIDDLIPYYDRAAKHLGLGDGSGFTDERVWSYMRLRRPSIDFDCDQLLPMFWQFSRDPLEPHDKVRFSRHIGELGANITVVTNATVLRVNANESGTSVDSVEFADAGGRRWALPVATVVVCAGGIENARILLSSDNIVAAGLGNEHDLVGRYLMDHLRGTVARFPIEQGMVVLKRFGTFKSRASSANLYHFGMRLSPDLQRREQLLNSALWVSADSAPDDPWDALSRLAHGKANIRKDLRAVLANGGLLCSGARERLVNHRGLPRKYDEIYVHAMCEQRPDRHSRITLSERRDRLGMRVAKLDWRVGADEARTLRRVTQLMLEQLSRMGLPSPVLEDWVREGAMFPRTFRDVAHPTGTTRMADDPTQGVVDAECKVHGVHGLYVTGTSVFPTAGQSNPTQTIVALAVRLADTLKAASAVAENVGPVHTSDSLWRGGG